MSNGQVLRREEVKGGGRGINKLNKEWESRLAFGFVLLRIKTNDQLNNITDECNYNIGNLGSSDDVQRYREQK